MAIPWSVDMLLASTKRCLSQSSTASSSAETEGRGGRGGAGAGGGHGLAGVAGPFCLPWPAGLSLTRPRGARKGGEGGRGAYADSAAPSEDVALETAELPCIDTVDRPAGGGAAAAAALGMASLLVLLLLLLSSARQRADSWASRPVTSSKTAILPTSM